MTFLSRVTIARMFMFDGSGHGSYLKMVLCFYVKLGLFWKAKGLGKQKKLYAPFEGPLPTPLPSALENCFISSCFRSQKTIE